MKKLPKEILVVLKNKETNDEYFHATTDIKDVEDGEMFGRYKQVSLERVEKITVTHPIIKRKTTA